MVGPAVVSAGAQRAAASPVTPAQIDRARARDLITLARHMGYETAPTARGEHCLVRHDSLKISRNRWCWHSRGRVGGSTIDFAMRFGGLSFPDAVRAVLAATGGDTPGAADVCAAGSGSRGDTCDESRGDRQLTLPPRADSDRTVTAYLTARRGLSEALVRRALDDGSVYEDTRRNCVFVGFDEAGAARYATRRGTGRRFHADCPGSDKRFGFVLPGDESLWYLFESPIDALSHATLAPMRGWSDGVRLSLGGTSPAALMRRLEHRPAPRRLILCLDNDDAGRASARALVRTLARHPVRVTVCHPARHDFNDELCRPGDGR